MNWRKHFPQGTFVQGCSSHIGFFYQAYTPIPLGTENTVSDLFTLQVSPSQSTGFVLQACLHKLNIDKKILPCFPIYFFYLGKERKKPKKSKRTKNNNNKNTHKFFRAQRHFQTKEKGFFGSRHEQVTVILVFFKVMGTLIENEMLKN